MATTAVLKRGIILYYTHQESQPGVELRVCQPSFSWELHSPAVCHELYQLVTSQMYVVRAVCGVPSGVASAHSTLWTSPPYPDPIFPPFLMASLQRQEGPGSVRLTLRAHHTTQNTACTVHDVVEAHSCVERTVIVRFRELTKTCGSKRPAS